MISGSADWYVVVFPVLILLHLLVAPYTKVEESFNMQATHDILQYGIPVGNVSLKFKALFDHMTFSGSVPRTFVGALVLAGLSKPFVWLGTLHRLSMQIAARAVLGLLNAAALMIYAVSIRRAYGQRTALWYTIFQASQFHILFYASRTLPNMFAFCLSTFALSSLLPDPTTSMTHHIRRQRKAYYLFTIAAVIFRAEIALFMASHAGYEILKSGSINSASRLIRQVLIPSVLVAGVASLVISVPIDTFFWQSKTPLFPELMAFWFNVFPKDHLGASAWGISPWHWYFTSALPRLIMVPSLLLIPYGLLFSTQRIRILDALLPSLIYITIYSILPHKETRFIFPTVPSLTLATAIPASYFSLRRDTISKLVVAFLTLSAAFTAFISHVILLPISAQNYPGGIALSALHNHLLSSQRTTPQAEKCYVHLTNLALQSGVTRFLEQLPPPSFPSSLSKSFSIKTKIFYDKSPSTPSTLRSPNFDYLIIEPTHMNTSSFDLDSWNQIGSVSSLPRSRPRLIRSDGSEGCLVLKCMLTKDRDTDRLYLLFANMYGKRIAWVYGALHDVLREGYGTGGRSLTKGIWLDWGLEDKLLILKRKQIL